MTPFSYRAVPSSSGPSFFDTAVGRIILITVGVFFLQNLYPPLNAYLALTPRLVVGRLFVWQLVTYMFLHGGFWHLFFNLIILYFFGNMVESVWGARRFVWFYLVCGVGGGLLQMVLQYDASVIGASGAIFGVYVATAMLFPDAYVYLYFVLPVKVKYFVVGLAILQLANGIAGPSGIAYFAHLGGGITALFFFRSQILRHFRGSSRPKRQWPGTMAEPRRPQPPRREPTAPRPETNIDSILDKISAKGYENLTPTEKRILENYSRQRNESSD